MKRLLMICLSGLVLFVCPLTTVGQKTANDLLSKKVTLVIANVDPKLVLEMVAHRTKTAIGFESLPEMDAKKINIIVRNGTLKHVLDSLIQEDPRYCWEVLDGVINVRPRHSKNSILEVMVNELSLTTADADNFGYTIANLSEVKSESNKLGLTYPEITETMGTPNRVHTFAISSSKMTVGQILNEVIRKGYATYWIFERLGEKNQYFQILLG